MTILSRKFKEMFLLKLLYKNFMHFQGQMVNVFFPQKRGVEKQKVLNFNIYSLTNSLYMLLQCC